MGEGGCGQVERGVLEREGLAGGVLPCCCGARVGTGEGVIGEGAVEGEDLADVDLRGDRCFVELLSGEGCGDEIALPADARDVDGGE